MNQKKLEELRQVAYRTIRILREIETGARSPSAIAVKTKSTPQLVIYYLNRLK